MNNSEIRARARMNLGGSIFHTDWLTALAVCFLASFISGIFPLVLFGPIAFGESMIFLKKARGGMIEFGDLFCGFDRFGECFVLAFMQGLFVFLWCLIPIVGPFIGIAKALGYGMSFYIKVDNPNMGWRECLDRSMIMMNGHRWEYFCLQFSFIGWMIVGALACGLGTLWVMPYLEAAKANYYEVRRMQGSGF